MFIMFNMHVCVCAHVCMCAWDTPYTPIPIPTPSAHLSPPGGTPGIGQNSITLELIKIFQYCLKIWNVGGLSTNHKSSNRIELSQLGQDLLNF